MKIESVKFQTPSTYMDNAAVLEEVRSLSKDTFEGDLERTIDSMAFMLENIGSKGRYWMKDEKPIDLITRAAEAAIDEARVSKNDIDILLFAGIGRGFLEPGDSYFISQALGLENVQCFDIMDACMSWTRACDVLQSFFNTGKYNRGLIVNCESYYTPGGISYPSNFQLRKIADIAYCFSAYCGGDGATATLLSHDPDNPWEINYSSTKKYADLCTIPLPGWEGRCGEGADTKKIALNGYGAFTSFSSQVFNAAGSHMVEILERLRQYKGEIKAIFAHTGGAVSEYDKWAKAAGMAEEIRYAFSEFGNLGSASIPASIAVATERGEIKRGDRIGSWMGSSGMSFMSSTFVY